jgi:hypothetical protein
MLFAVLALSSIALAGKPERDRQKELNPKLATAKAEMKKRCGCDVSFMVKWDSYQKADDMFLVEAALADLTEATKDNCDDDNEKKVLCSHLKSYVVSYDSNGAVSYASGALTCGTASSTHCGSNQLDAIINKW